MQRESRWQGQQGSIAPIFLMILFFMLLLGWILAGSTAAHYLQAARRSQEVLAGQLAQAGAEAAVARIDQGGTPPESLTGTEATGTYEVSIAPTGLGTFRVQSVGTARNRSRTITAEVKPPPEPFALMAGGNVSVTYATGVNIGGETRIVGDINAQGNVDLQVINALISVGTLRVQGDIRAGQNATVSAQTGALAEASAVVEGGVGANGDVILTTNAGALGTAIFEATGPVRYAGNLAVNEEGLGISQVSLTGGTLPGQGVSPPAVTDTDVAYYEALVDDLERKGEMLEVDPVHACLSPITQNTRVTGDLTCGILEVADGAMLVVDGSLSSAIARVQGLLYVRGAATADATGDISLGTLTLLEVVHSLSPASGGGAVVASGNIDVGTGNLAKLLSGSPGYGTVLQVLALSTGESDASNDLSFGMGGLADALTGGDAAPLFLYASNGGNIQIVDATVADAIAFTTLPLIAVADGDIAMTTGGLADAVTTLTLEARPEAWQQVPPFLQGMGRARVLSWEWTSP